nr:immunoglobulin heavy chain junction region [Macaca mulatta]MOX39941.1 immunoglobulin heavy chain junction region [Macaca mulatta]MOX41002.1 immunoglobulin heavy chain junction region [Macaca mulatta]MOX41160.1 immunoglobulin heavy chain junction region [Macaca mulatta]MOX41403.1 immunoglobulin heavy chain junction region [Macaca mulatta]
CARNHVSLDVW